MKVIVENKTGLSLNAEGMYGTSIEEEPACVLTVSRRPCDHQGAIRPLVFGGLLSHCVGAKGIFCFAGWAFSAWCPWCGSIRLREQEGKNRAIWLEPDQSVGVAIANRETNGLLEQEFEG